MSQTPDLPTEPTAPRRWQRIVLIVSLCLNFIILGVIGGGIVSHIVHGPRMPVRDLGFGPYTAALSPGDRIALMRSFVKDTNGFRAEREQMRADFGDVLAALRAKPFDRGAFEAVMARQQTRFSDRLALGQKLLSDRVEAMSDQDRAGFADRLEAVLSRGPHHGGPEGGPDGD